MGGFDEEEFSTILWAVPAGGDVEVLRKMVKQETERIAMALTVFDDPTYLLGNTLDFHGIKVHVSVERCAHAHSHASN